MGDELNSIGTINLKNVQGGEGKDGRKEGGREEIKVNKILYVYMYMYLQH